MAYRIKVAARLGEPNSRIARSNGCTCMRHCPKLAEYSPGGVTWRQMMFCPIRGCVVMPDTALCAYGRRLAHSASVMRNRKKAASRQTAKNGPVAAPRKGRKNGRQKN